MGVPKVKLVKLDVPNTLAAVEGVPMLPKGVKNSEVLVLVSADSTLL